MDVWLNLTQEQNSSKLSTDSLISKGGGGGGG
jgi:hypothetical protein